MECTADMNPNTIPLVSIIVPSYNRSSYLCRLLDSIKKLKYGNIEIVVIDDNSSENYEDVLSEYKAACNLVYIKNSSNCYAEASRRKGFHISTGEYVIFCDDDDYYTDDCFLQGFVNLLIQDPNLSFVSGNARLYFQATESVSNKPLNIEGEIDGIEYIRHFQTKFNKPLSTFTTVFRRNSLIDEGVYFNDSSLYLEALLHGNCYIVGDIVGNYCVHASNMTSNVPLTFISEVIRSKYEVYCRLKKRVKWNPRSWWINQLIITSKVYIRSDERRPDEVRDFMNGLVEKYDCHAIRFRLYCYYEMARKIVLS